MYVHGLGDAQERMEDGDDCGCPECGDGWLLQTDAGEDFVEFTCQDCGHVVEHDY